jgi:hypothetical protein
MARMDRGVLRSPPASSFPLTPSDTRKGHGLCRCFVHRCNQNAGDVDRSRFLVFVLILGPLIQEVGYSDGELIAQLFPVTAGI